MEKRNPAKVLSNRSKPKRIALSEVSNTQLPASKESEIIKRWLQSETRDSASPKEVVYQTNSPSTVTEENSATQKTTMFNGTRELNIPTPRIVASPTKVTCDPSQKDTSSPNTTLNEIENPNVLKEITNPPNVTSESRPVAKRKRAPNTSNSIIVASLPTFEHVNLEMIDMVLITNILSIYDFIVKFEKLLELDLSYNRDRLNYDDLEEMILDNQFHTYLAFLQARLLSFLYKESEEGCDIDLVNLQYFLIERFPNRKFLCEKEYSEFDPRERTSVFLDLMNDALHTNKFREYIRELMMPATHKKENETRSERMKEIKFKVNEIRVKIVDKENEMKAIENQIKEIHMNCEREDVEFPNAVTKRQRIVAQRKAETELHEHLKDAADEIEIFSYSLDKLEMEHKELDMLNKTERNHALCTLRGGSILNPSGRDERFYMVARLGQDRDGRYYWFFRPLGGVFIETIKWNYSEQGSEDSSLPITSSSEWQMISGIGELRMLMAALNAQDDREMSLKTNLKTLENEIESTFEMLNLRLEKKRDAQTEKMEVDSEEVKLIMSQRQKSFWKLFDTVIRKKNVWSSEEYHVIMKEYVKRKIVEFEKILQEVDLNLVFKTCESNSSVNASDYVNEIKKMISETGLIFTDDDDASSTTSSKKDKNWGWLYEVAVNWYSLEIKTFSILAVWLDVMINSGEPVVRSIKRRMREQLSEKFKCSSRLRNKKGKAVVYKEEISDEEIGDEIDGEENENEDGNFEAQKQPSKWSFRQRKRDI
ncbi:5099_t:CDS:2 [Funneliformis caledonium]|uniref:5099_t:CDS:1 n=1 Tax=Funneliformis caledonium TaxID=1117310 RepID=A0A9N9GKM6_9GLOM|nr:5099_t:CDS:2 [Funneliformis caledonium]